MDNFHGQHSHHMSTTSCQPHHHHVVGKCNRLRMRELRLEKTHGYETHIFPHFLFKLYQLCIGVMVLESNDSMTPDLLQPGACMPQAIRQWRPHARDAAFLPQTREAQLSRMRDMMSHANLQTSLMRVIGCYCVERREFCELTELVNHSVACRIIGEVWSFPLLQRCIESFFSPFFGSIWLRENDACLG